MTDGQVPALTRPPFRTERQLAAAIPPDVLMRRIREPATWHEWQPEVWVAEGPGVVRTGDEVVGRARLLGYHIDARSRIVEAGPGAMEQDVIVGLRMRVRYEVRPAPGGSLLTHRIEADMPGGVSGRILSLFLRPRLRRVQRDLMANLARTAR